MSILFFIDLQARNEGCAFTGRSFGLWTIWLLLVTGRGLWSKLARKYCYYQFVINSVEVARENFIFVSVGVNQHYSFGR